MLLLCALCALSFLVGCAPGGPTATPGTQGLPHDQLAVVHIIKHGAVHEWKGRAVHIESFSVGGVAYYLPQETRDLLVSPGEHTFRVEYSRCIHGITGPESIEDDGIFVPPFGEFKAVIDPGGHYTLVGNDHLVGGNGVQTEHHLVPNPHPSTQPH